MLTSNLAEGKYDGAKSFLFQCWNSTRSILHISHSIGVDTIKNEYSEMLIVELFITGTCALIPCASRNRLYCAEFRHPTMHSLDALSPLRRGPVKCGHFASTFGYTCNRVGAREAFPLASVLELHPSSPHPEIAFL